MRPSDPERNPKGMLNRAPSSFLSETQKFEAQALHPCAASSGSHQRQNPLEDEYRLPFKRDADRILHSKAYSRYEDKTQVIYLLDNDHISHRSLHVQLVSSYARGIGRALRLNTDLIEAIALGHDVGHPPFGHEGEGYLSELSTRQGNGPFAHPWQSCRLFRLIEPLDLGLAVYDGFLCHDGGLDGPQLLPRFGKTSAEHERELSEKKLDPQCRLIPATLEGCLVKVCDTISYLARDIKDALSVGILNSSQVPRIFQERGWRGILERFAKDLLCQSAEQDFIAFSDQAFEELSLLRAFNFEHIYFHPRLKKESEKIRRSYNYLFAILLEDYEANQEKSYLFRNFIQNRSEEYRRSSTPAQSVVDYIAGMTDRFFLHTLEKLCIPQTMTWL